MASELQMARCTAREDKHFNWKGDNIGYAGVHKWIQRTLGKPNLCSICGITNSKKYEWANISGEYKRDITDWKRLCVSCHRLYDDHSNKAWDTRGRKKTIEITCPSCSIIFLVSQNRLDSGRGKYCSKVCMTNSTEWRKANSDSRVGRKRDSITKEWL